MTSADILAIAGRYFLVGLVLWAIMTIVQWWQIRRRLGPRWRMQLDPWVIVLWMVSWPVPVVVLVIKFLSR